MLLIQDSSHILLSIPFTIAKISIPERNTKRKLY
nr:MAG TPA: hypothetical protein [Caudoviricetes sp.]